VRTGEREETLGEERPERGGRGDPRAVCHSVFLALVLQGFGSGAKMVDLRWSRTELRNRDSSSVFGLQRAGFQGLLRRSRLPVSRLAGLRVEPEPESPLEPCGPKNTASAPSAAPASPVGQYSAGHTGPPPPIAATPGATGYGCLPASPLLSLSQSLSGCP